MSLVQMQGRDLSGTAPAKYLALSNEVEIRGRSIYQCLGGEEILDLQPDEIDLCEGWPDRFTLASWRMRAVNLFGHSGMEKHAHKLKGVKRIYSILDPDEASQKRLLTNLYQLNVKIPHVEIRVVHLDTSGQDLNAWGLAGKRGPFFSPYSDELLIEQLQEMKAKAPHLLDRLVQDWGPHPHLLQPLVILLARVPDPDPWIYKLAKLVGESEASVRFLMRVLSPTS
jgi:hypothetical protein